jgi:hypothetical protein
MTRRRWRQADFLLIFRGPSLAAVCWSFLTFLLFLALGWLLLGWTDLGLRGNLVKNYHLIILAATGAIGTLVFKAAQDRNDRQTQSREERRQASEAFFRWAEKLESPRLRETAWRAIQEYALREPSLEQQAIALAQGVVQRWLLENTTDPSQKEPKNSDPEVESPIQIPEDDSDLDIDPTSIDSTTELITQLSTSFVSHHGAPTRSGRDHLDIAHEKQARNSQLTQHKPPIERDDALYAWQCLERILMSPVESQEKSKIRLFSVDSHGSSEKQESRLLVSFPAAVVTLSPRGGRSIDLQTLSIGPRPVRMVVKSDSVEAVRLPEVVACNATVDVHGSLRWNALLVRSNGKVELNIFPDGELIMANCEIDEDAILTVAISHSVAIRLENCEIRGQLRLVKMSSTILPIVDSELTLTGRIGGAGTLLIQEKNPPEASSRDAKEPEASPLCFVESVFNMSFLVQDASATWNPLRKCSLKFERGSVGRVEVASGSRVEFPDVVISEAKFFMGSAGPGGIDIDGMFLSSRSMQQQATVIIKGDGPVRAKLKCMSGGVVKLSSAESSPKCEIDSNHMMTGVVELVHLPNRASASRQEYVNGQLVRASKPKSEA